jgi:flagellin
MPNSIVTNTAANTALRYLQMNGSAASSSVAKLSSGSRIVKASDDAASLSVGTKLKADVAALKQAEVNASQATSLLQVADGGMARIADILQRMKQLAVQASSGSLTNTERAYLNEEFTQLRSQVTAVANETKFNGQALLNGSLATSVVYDTTWNAGAGARGISVRVVGDVGPNSAKFQISFAQDNAKGIGTFTLTEQTGNNRTFSVSIQTGTAGTVVLDRTISFDDAGIELVLSNFVAIANGAKQDLAAAANTEFTVNQAGTLDFQVGVLTTEKISVSLSKLDATGLAIDGSTIDTAANAQTASNVLDTAIQTVNAARASVGALMSRFEAAAANLATGIENIEAARSTLMDVDVAAEMAKFTSAQVLMQANVAMLAQANQMPQNLLRLLQ